MNPARSNPTRLLVWTVAVAGVLVIGAATGALTSVAAYGQQVRAQRAQVDARAEQVTRTLGAVVRGETDARRALASTDASGVDPSEASVLGAAHPRLVVELVAVGAVLAAGVLILVLLVRRYRSEARAQAQSERIAAFLIELAVATTPGQLVDAVGNLARDAFECTAVVVWLCDRRNGTWRQHSVGAPSIGPLDVDATRPIGEAILRRTPIVLESRAEAERQYPHGAAAPRDVALEMTANVPAVDDTGASIAAIGFGWSRRRSIGRRDLARLNTVSALCGEAWRRIALEDATACWRDAVERLARASSAADALVAVTEGDGLVGATITGYVVESHGARSVTRATPGTSGPAIAIDDADVAVAQAIRSGTCVLDRARPGEPGVTRAAVPFPEGGDGVGAVAVLTWPRPVSASQAAAAVGALVALLDPVLGRIRSNRLLERRRRSSEVRAEFSARLAGATTVLEAADLVAAYAMELFAASGATVMLLDDPHERLVVVAERGLGSGAVAGRSSVRLDESGPAVDAFLLCTLVVVPDREQIEARYPQRRDLLGEPAVEALAAVPLVVAGRPVGAVRLQFRAGALEPDLLGQQFPTFADHAAQALERARLAESERRALAQATLLRDTVAAVGRAGTESELADAVLGIGVDGMGASAGGIVLRDEHDPSMLRVPASQGFDPTTVRRWTAFPLDRATPVGVAIQTNAAVYLSDRDDARERFPAIVSELVSHGHPSVANLPLRDGPRCVGALSLSFDEPQPFDAVQRDTLERYAESVAHALVRARAASAEHETVAALQRQLLPSALPPVAVAQVAARYCPAVVSPAIGGDWYDVIPIGPARVALVVGDVVGNGAGAAATMGQLRTAMRTVAPDAGPADAVSALDRVASTFGSGMIATVAYCIFDATGRTLTYCSAGHPPIALATGEAVRWLGANGPPIGVDVHGTRREVTEPLPAHARAVLFSDGLVERRGEALDVGFARLAAVVDRTLEQDPDAVADELLVALGASQIQADDIALLVADLRSLPDPFVRTRPADPNVIPGLRRALRQWLVDSVVSEAAAEELVIAANEAIANAVEHGSSGNGTHVTVRATRTDDQVEIVVDDEGTAVASTSDPHRGRGFGIMRTLVDEVEFTPSLVGSSLRLVRRIT